MSDSPPPPATTDEPATMSANRPVTSAESDKMTVAPMLNGTPHQEFFPGCGAAIFSTDLCTEAKRPVSGPPYPPVIVRSDDVKGVVQAASFWQRKFKTQCLCIFPGQGWSVNDLWDDADLHLDSPSFCQKMLVFIERDTYYAAKQFAEDWSREYPDRLKLIGGDMTGVYDPQDTFAIVDKIFNKGEINDFPRTFLWHVAHMMRTTMMEVSRANSAALAADHVQQPSHMEQQDASKAAVDSTAAKASSVVPTDVARKSSSAVPPAAPAQPSLHPASKRTPSYAPPQPGGYYTEPMGNIMGGMGGPSMMSPIMHPQGIKVPKGNTRNMGSGSYNQAMPNQGWAENMNRVPSGPYPRIPPGNIQSPQFIPTSMAMGQPMMMPPGAIPPYAQGPPMMSSHMAAIHPFDPAMAQRVMMPQQPGPMQTPPMGQAYLHQPHGPRGASMGDMTNNMYYPNNMAPQHIDPRAPMPRRASQYNSNGTLYDPYSGANSKFNDAAAYNGGKKATPNNFANQPSRPRNISASGNRTANMPSNVPRYSGFNSIRGSSEDDPSITGDHSSGCHETWIGPNNGTVTELFVGDLPPDAQDEEVMLLFQQQVGINPTHVSIKRPQYGQPWTRCHAFVSFASAADAKNALEIRERNARLRNGSVSVTITVPRRFFQMLSGTVRGGSLTSGSYVGPSSHTSQADDRGARSITRISLHDEASAVTDADPAAASAKPLYSPQDARSDLQKKLVRQSNSNDSTLSGSPEARKSERRQSSPTKKQKAKRDEPVQKGVPTSDLEAATGKAEVAITTGDAPTTPQPTADTFEPSKQVTAGGTNTERPLTPLTEPTPIIGGATGAEETMKSKADKENPQTQSRLKSSPIDTKAPVVNIPSSTEAKEVGHAESAQITANPSPQPGEDTVSDDETKNDVSFHTAQESQTDPTHVEPKLELRDVSIDANHGTMSSKTHTTGEAIKPTTSPPDQTISEGDIEAPATTSSPHQTTSEGDTEAPAQTVATMSEPNVGAMATPSADPLTDITKKNGAQQVSSLSPFAKPSKAQQKKEKELRRKQQKKEQAEKAEKAKAEKDKALAAKEKTEQPQTFSTEPTQPKALVKPTATGQDTADQATQGPKEPKGNRKASSVINADQEKKSKGDSKESGKPNGGNTTTTIIPKETASVTHKADIAKTPKVEPVKQVSSTAFGTPSVNPPEDGAQPSPKKKNPLPAVPYLNLPHRLSTHSKDIQLDPTAASTPSSPTTTVPKAPEIDIPHSTTPPDASSVASSATLQAEDTSLMPPTPIEPVSSQVDATGVEAPKKKSRKSRKKKKLDNAAAESTNPAVAAELAEATYAPDSDTGKDYHRYDPFQSQMTHIEAVRRAVNKNTNSYFHQTNEAIEAEKKAAEDEDDDDDDDDTQEVPDSFLKLPESLLSRYIHGYSHENRNARKLSQNDLN